MISVSDIVKLLDQVPIWRALVSLPKRVAELEARVAALEAKPKLEEKPCPLCGEAMRVSSVTPDPTFGTFGVQQHTMRCDACGHSETRQFDPNKRS